MTTDTLKRILELAERATPGPWHTQECSNGGAILRRGRSERPGAHPQSHLQIVPTEDAAFIAAANPQLVADLIRLALAARAYRATERYGHLDRLGVCRDELDAALAKVRER